MILRRISQAVTNQDWFVLLVEIMVVVVGIFLGLQVDDWNQARKDRIDEKLFLDRLHADIVLADELAARVRERRIGVRTSAEDLADVLFSRVERNELSEQECKAVQGMVFFNINAVGLSSVDELVATGRMDIISSAELRTGLVKLEQTREALAAYINTQTTSVAGGIPATRYPELMSLQPVIDPQTNEVRVQAICDVALMQRNQTFLNEFTVNFDRYDAYIRDGLAPWSKQFDHVHGIVDEILGLSHEAEPGG